MKLKLLLALAMAMVLVVLAACGNGGTATTSAAVTNPTTSGAANTGPSYVEVNYFYEAEACFCLGLATEWVNNTLNNDYKAQQESGKLVYKSWNTQDPANKPMMEQFKAPAIAVMITTVKGEARNTTEVKGLWLYTDSSGTNEMLKSKFIGLLKKEIDKALAAV